MKKQAVSPPRPMVGAGGAVQKYDLLTALSVDALRRSVAHRTSVLRLIAVVTARYDWRRDQLSVGREELARLWGVSEPTVKREMGRLRKLGFLELLEPGVRGRVTRYRLGHRAIAAATAEACDGVGPAFRSRMAGLSPPAPHPAEQGTAPRDRKVVPLYAAPPGGQGAEPEDEAESWATCLRALDPVVFRNWFSGVRAEPCPRAGVIFRAPSAFTAQHIQRHHDRLLAEVVDACWGPGTGFQVVSGTAG